VVPGRAARCQQARFILQQGLQFQFALGGGREDALRNLEEARTLYRQLATESQDSPVLAQEALMGAATAEEALIGTPLPDNAEGERGTLDHAIDDYQKLADTYPDRS